MEKKIEKVQELNLDQMEKVSGGDGITIVYDYECKSCFTAWESSGYYAVCKYCASPDIVINNQHTIYDTDGYEVFV